MGKVTSVLASKHPVRGVIHNSNDQPMGGGQAGKEHTVGRAMHDETKRPVGRSNEGRMFSTSYGGSDTRWKEATFKG